MGERMKKEDYISNCKQEELTSTLIVIGFELILFGFVLPEVFGDLLPLCVLVMFISIIVTFAIFWRSNKRMMLCYKLIHGNGVTTKAVVENYKVSPSRYSFYIMVCFRILETGNIYKWEEHYCECDSFHRLSSQMNAYLGNYPEFEVLVDPENHARNYILFEQIMLDETRQTQEVSKIINVIIGVVLLIVFVLIVRNIIISIF